MKLKTAVIIAGGKGTRLEEHTEDLPKPLIPICGKPILERMIEWLKKNGVENIVIGVAYKKEMIKNYVGDGGDFGVKITYTEHDEKGGTEDAFKAAILQSGIKDENFYAMNGDQLTDLQLEGLTNLHIIKGSIATLVTVKLRTNFGIIDAGNHGEVISFREKGPVPGYIINSGIYVFNKKIKKFLKGGNIEENTFRKLIKRKKIHSFYYDGLWLTVNDKKVLKRAEEFITKFEKLMK